LLADVGQLAPLLEHFDGEPAQRDGPPAGASTSKPLAAIEMS